MKKTIRQQKPATVHTAVFLTQTTLGVGIYDTGTRKSVFENNRQAFVLQGFMPMEVDGKCVAVHEKYVRETVEELFHELLNLSGIANHLVVYLGERGFESAIMLAAKFPQESVTFVSCPCNANEKMDALARARFKKMRVISSECSGWITMERLFHSFLDTGSPTLKDSVPK